MLWGSVGELLLLPLTVQSCVNQEEFSGKKSLGLVQRSDGIIPLV